jgi:hypothetical protein
MRRAGIVPVFAVTIIALPKLIGASADPPAAAEAPRYDIPYSTEVVTPHVPWATRLPGGPIKGFFVPSVAEGRDMVELLQRLALEATTVTIDRNWDVNCWGIGDYYGHEYRGDRDDFETVYRYAQEELTSDKRFEVILLPGLNGWSRLTRASRDAILRRVQEGAGLVLLHPFVGDVRGHPFKGDEPEGDRRIWDLSPLVNVPDDFVSERGYPELNTGAIDKGKWERATPHFISEGVPLALLPAGAASGRFYKYEARGDVVLEAGGHPILATKAHGKGRVVAFAYVEEGFLPEPVDQVESRVYWDYWEYEYALLVRSLIWAAGRETRTISTLRVTSEDRGSSRALELTLASKTARSVEIEVFARSEFEESVERIVERKALTASPAEVRISLDRLRASAGSGSTGSHSAGRRIFDVIVRDAASGATLDFGTAMFDVPKVATVSGLKPNATVYRQGDTMSVVTRAAGALEGLKMRLEVWDDLGRLLHAEEKTTPGEKYFFYRLDDFVGKRALLRASLVDGGGGVVDQLRAAPVVVVQRERRQKEYQALLSFEGARHGLGPLRGRRLRALAMDNGFTWGGSVNDSLDIPRGYFGVYWYDRGPTTPEGLDRAIKEYEASGDASGLQYLTRKELYKRTGDKRFLVRSPSLDDPQVLEVLADVARAAGRNKAVYNMDYYFVGDEGSLTSYTDEVDFCFGPHTLAKFRKWLETKYAGLEALNRTWRTSYTRWEDVMPSTSEEARRTGVFPPWADHRTYMEHSFANAYAVVRNAVREADPEGRIALSGTQVTTPWNGCDWHQLDGVIDDFLSYDGGNQWDLHRSFAKPGSRVGFWTGYGRRGLAVQHEIWNAALSGVLFPNLFWSYSVVNPDLTFSRSGNDMGTVFQALRFEGLGKLLMEAERLDDGIAIHYSMPSVHAAGILGFHPRGRDDEDDPGFPRNRDGWTRSLTDLGFSYTFLSAEQVAEGALESRRTKAFIVPFSLALSPKEAAAIEGYTRSGGIVVADAAVGLFDEHAAWRSEGLLNRFFGLEAPPSEKRSLSGPRDAASPVKVTAEGRSWGLDEESLQGLSTFEPDLRATDGVPLAEIGGHPAILARRVGKGWALYLNVLFDQYPRLRRDGYGGAAYRDLLRAVLAHLGLRPAVAVNALGGQPVAAARISRYRFGTSEIVAVLQEPLDVGKTHGRDGVSVYDDAKLGPLVRQELEVRLPRSAEVVNVRTGAGLGRTDRVTTTLTAGDALVLAMNPGPTGSLTLAGPTEATLGTHPRFAVTSSEAGERLVRVQVLGPDGVRRPEYGRNLILRGRPMDFVLPSAVNDPPGRYRITVTDVLSGATGAKTLELR